MVGMSNSFVKYVASCSMGKDSLAMVLRLLEEDYPLDEVVWFNFGNAEFNCLHENAKKLKPVLEEKGITFTELRPDKPFEYYMLEKEVCKRDGECQKGYQWCGGTCRWGTSLKLDAIHKHEATYGDYLIVEYVGVAADERHRIHRQRDMNRVKLYPLVEWGMVEADCLEYCFNRGWHWLENGFELYSVNGLDRVSCKWCKNKNLHELRNIYNNMPGVWKELVELQDKIPMPFKPNATIYDLGRKFALENAQLTLF